MEHVELFLLLPIYQEAVGHPGYLRRIDIKSNEDYRTFIDNIVGMKSFFCYENFKGYYDSENLKAFKMPIDTLSDCYPKTSVLIRKAMVDWGTDWRRRKTISDDDEVHYFSESIKNDTICEVAKRQLEDADSSFLVVDCEAFVHKSDKREIDFNNTSLALCTCSLSESDLSEWFANNRKPARIFHLNPKHGENGKGAHSENKGDEVSVLLCSEDTARELLMRAIGEDRECRTLYYYDAENKSYIEFKCEGGNTYHGFHIKDEQVKVRVPAKVIQKIEFLLKNKFRMDFFPWKK